MVNDDWPQQLARSLHARRLTATLEQRLDTLLIWLGNPDNHHVAELDAAIVRSGLTRSVASERAYDLLDQLLFASGQPATSTLGLSSSADPVKAKRRYRRLIQAYHPDRHPLRAAELTDRTERINLAFRALTDRVFIDGSDAEVSRPGKSDFRTSRAGTQKPRSNTGRATNRTRYRGGYYYDATAASGPTLAARLRRRLGAADSFQIRFFTGLILICGLLLGSLLYFDEEPALRGSRPGAVAPSPETAAMTETVMVSEALPGSEEPAASNEESDTVPQSVPVATVSELIALEGVGRMMPEPLPVVDRTDPSDLPAEHAVSPDQSLSVNEPAPQSPPQVDIPADPQRERLRTALVSAWPVMVRTLATPEPVSESQPAPEPRAVPFEQPPSSSGTPRATPEPKPTVQAKPRPVERPEPTPQPSTRPEPAPSPAVANCDAARDILMAFRRAYETGQPSRLMALYSPAATENATRGRTGIRALYTDWFERTSERRFSFDRVAIREQDSAHCVATARFRVSYRDAGQRLIDQSGTIEFRLERHDSGLRILRLSY